MEVVWSRAGVPLPEADTTVIGCYQDPRSPEPGIDTSHDDDTMQLISRLLDDESFKADVGETRSVTVLTDQALRRVVVVGLGKRSELNSEGIRKAVNAAVSEAKHLKSRILCVHLLGHSSSAGPQSSARLIPEIALLSVYQFDKYKSEKKTETLELLAVNLGSSPAAELQAAVQEGVVLGNATATARDLVNEPANVLTPDELARRTESIGAESGFEVEVFEEQKIEALKMLAYLEVARAAANRPRLIVLRYSGDARQNADTVALVGKGLTYDSGGLSIKTNDGMLTMKRDMGGAAAVIGAMAAIARQRLAANAVGVIAACENMVSERSFRPGDIIGSMAGKSIYVASTDAEGRLTLIDAIHYAIEKEGATKIADIATLTGAATHTLGYAADVVVSNSDELYAALEQAADAAGEKKWRMPIFDEYKQQVKTDEADLTNAPGRPGAVTAGVFIGEFVQDRPWVHIDIAPSAWVDENKGYRHKGGTGSGVRSLYHLVKQIL
jgi:leucyl aminopeptidase